MNFVDRSLTVVITATLTSAFWIIAGGTLLENADSDSQIATTRPAEAAPSPSPSASTVEDMEASEVPAPVAGLDTETASQPDESETRSLMVPVLNVRPADLSDTFNKESADGSSLHEALDIMAPDGTSVVAAAPGTIEKLFVSEAGGKTMYIRSSDRQTIHYYAHLGKYAEGLKEGQRVRRGQRLGTVGSTGNAKSNSAHLHFAILRTTKDAQWWEPANAVNPYPLFTN